MGNKIFWVMEPVTDILNPEFEKFCIGYCDVRTCNTRICKPACDIFID